MVSPVNKTLKIPEHSVCSYSPYVRGFFGSGLVKSGYDLENIK